MTDTIERSECRIYVADLAAYNSGRLRGKWIDLDGKDESDVFNEINAMLANSPDSNVVRRKCDDCDHHQDDRADDDECDECGGTLGAAFPSAEEWAIHDHEGFAGMISSEWPDIGELCEAAAILARNGRRGLIYLVSDCGYKIPDAIPKAEDVRFFEGRAEDYAAEFVEDCYSDTVDKMPSFIRHRIDWEGIARDLLLGGDIAECTIEGAALIVTNASEF